MTAETVETTSGADQAPLAGSARGARARLERAVPFLPGFIMLTFLFLIPMAIMLVYSLWRTNTEFNIVSEWNLTTTPGSSTSRPTCGHSPRPS